ncbi:MAG: class II aldolase/adducin family protein [Chloroflexi bacterium]|nr:class II aldolase/adducin family protein [Chloroflexota bacterium]
MIADESLLGPFHAVGRDMFLTGLVSSHSGTMSVQADGRTFVSRRNAMLGRLTTDDFIELPAEGENPEGAPEDALIHRAIYRLTQARAVIHARPAATMAIALIDDRLAPANGEGADAFGTVPVAISQRPLGSPEVADLMGQMLRESRIAVLRGRGVFAWGEDLDSALHMVSLLEEMCRVGCWFRAMSREDEQPVAFERQERGSNLSPYRSSRDGNTRQPMRHGNQPRRSGGGGAPPRRDGQRRPGNGSPGGFRP